MAYALPPNEAKKIGKWKQVEWDATTDKHEEFFADEGNINKLFVPRKNKNLTKEKKPRGDVGGPKGGFVRTNQAPIPSEVGEVGKREPIRRGR